MSPDHVGPVIAIVGPTASGKTALSIALAQWLQSAAGLNGLVAIISADSQLLYQGLDIGTAKPTQEERDGIPHYGIDLATPVEMVTVAQYAQAMTAQLNACWQAGIVPIVVGGSGFYVQALLQERTFPQVPPHPDIRAHWLAAAHDQPDPAAWLYAQLQERDPLRASQLYPQDTTRVLRALEIIEMTGQPVPQQANTVVNRYPKTLWLGTTWADRDAHRQVIAERVQAMVTAGWQEEVVQLIAQWGPAAHALKVAHGYPEWVAVAQGTMMPEEAMAIVTLNVQQYARRQRTWFGRNAAIQWLAVDTLGMSGAIEQAKTAVKNFFAENSR